MWCSIKQWRCGVNPSFLTPVSTFSSDSSRRSPPVQRRAPAAVRRARLRGSTPNPAALHAPCALPGRRPTASSCGRAPQAGHVPRGTGSRPPLGSPLCAPLGARVRAVGRVCSCAGDDYPPDAPPRSSAAMRPVGPLTGVPCELVARHAVEGLHWMPLSATTRGGSRCHALLRRLVVSNR